MAVLGIRSLRVGLDPAEGDEEFVRFLQPLRSHGATILMAGDTHDLEGLRRTGRLHRRCGPLGQWSGGAYLSFRTSIAWPARRPPSTGRTTRTLTR